MSKTNEIIKKLNQERTSQFEEWAELNFSRKSLLERINNANQEGFTGIIIEITNLPNRTIEYKNFIRTPNFMKYLERIMPEFNITKKEFTVSRFNIFTRTRYETEEKRIVIDWREDK